MSQEKEHRTSFKEMIDGTDVTIEVSGEGPDVHEVAWKLLVMLEKWKDSEERAFKDDAGVSTSP